MIEHVTKLDSVVFLIAYAVFRRQLISLTYSMLSTLIYKSQITKLNKSINA